MTTPGYPGRPLPPRLKAHSQPDAEVPEQVYGLLQGLERAVTGLAAEMRTGFAAQDVKVAEVKVLAEKASSISVERWTNLAKALVPAVVAIVGGVVGGVKLTERAPQQTTVVSESALSVDLGDCETLPESNQPACVQAAYERDQARKQARALRR